MKKIIALILAIVMCLGMCACASEENNMAGKYKNEGHFCRLEMDLEDNSPLTFEVAYYQYYVLDKDGTGHIEGELAGVYKGQGEGINYDYEFTASDIEKWNQEIRDTFTWSFSDGYLNIVFDEGMQTITFQKQGNLFVEETAGSLVSKLSKVS